MWIAVLFDLSTTVLVAEQSAARFFQQIALQAWVLVVAPVLAWAQTDARRARVRESRAASVAC